MAHIMHTQCKDKGEGKVFIKPLKNGKKTSSLLLFTEVHLLAPLKFTNSLFSVFRVCLIWRKLLSEWRVIFLCK